MSAVSVKLNYHGTELPVDQCSAYGVGTLRQDCRPDKSILFLEFTTDTAILHVKLLFDKEENHQKHLNDLIKTATPLISRSVTKIEIKMEAEKTEIQLRANSQATAYFIHNHITPTLTGVAKSNVRSIQLWDDGWDSAYAYSVDITLPSAEEKSDKIKAVNHVLDQLRTKIVGIDVHLTKTPIQDFPPTSESVADPRPIRTFILNQDDIVENLSKADLLALIKGG